MIVVVGVDDGVERARVNDRDHGPTRSRGSLRGLARSSDGRFGRAPRTGAPGAQRPFDQDEPPGPPEPPARLGLRDTLRRDGSWSVISQPGLRFEVLASSVRNNQVRRTTAGAIMELGGSLIADRSGDAPPYHCHLSGLTPEQLDSILEPPERNPVPVHR